MHTLKACLKTNESTGVAVCSEEEELIVEEERSTVGGNLQQRNNTTVKGKAHSTSAAQKDWKEISPKQYQYKHIMLPWLPSICLSVCM